MGSKRRWDEGRNAMALLKDSWLWKRFVCVGPDLKWDQMPGWAIDESDIFGTMWGYNQPLIKATAETGAVAAFKFNLGPYFDQGHEGIMALEQSMKYVHKIAPEIVVILDAKFGDIESSNKDYAHGAFNRYQADAVTVQPMPGEKDLRPFLDRKDKITIILCHMSGKGAPEFQDLEINGVSLYKLIAGNVSQKWEGSLDNCMLVVGATYPDQVKETRMIVGDLGLLFPGIGKQEGEEEKTVKWGKNSANNGFLVNSSRGIIFASPNEDFAEVAAKKTLELNNRILAHLEA